MKLFLAPTAQPTVEPVTLGHVKAQLRIDDTTEDALIFGDLIAAREMVETDIGQSLGSRTLTGTLEAWPATAITIASIVSSITSITYTNAAGATVAWTGFVVRPGIGTDTLIRPAALSDWPALGDDPIITITATGGLNPLPEMARLAVIMLVAHWHQNREPISIGETVNEIPLGYNRLIALLRSSFIA
jgi:uncharacterized phiE125 gp8 family phage protein